MKPRDLQRRRPPPLKLHNQSHVIHKPEGGGGGRRPDRRTHHQNHHQQQQRPPGGNYRIVQTYSPTVIHTDPRGFMQLVQNLTGAGPSGCNNTNISRLAPPLPSPRPRFKPALAQQANPPTPVAAYPRTPHPLLPSPSFLFPMPSPASAALLDSLFLFGGPLPSPHSGNLLPVPSPSPNYGIRFPLELLPSPLPTFLWSPSLSPWAAATPPPFLLPLPSPLTRSPLPYSRPLLPHHGHGHRHGHGHERSVPTRNGGGPTP